MRIISKKTLKEFYEQKLYKDSKNSLKAWHQEVLKANWSNPNEVKKQFGNTSMVGDNRVVFNIHGNKYRLIVKVNYFAQIIFIRFIGTHKQYDNINATEV